MPRSVAPRHTIEAARTGRGSGRGVSARALFAEGDVSPLPIPRRQPRPAASCSLPTSPRPAASSAARCLRPSARSPPAKGDVPSVGSRAATRPVARGWSPPPPPLSSPASAALRVGTSRAAVPWRRPRRRLSRPSTWSCCSAKSRLPPSRPRVLVRGGLVHGRPPPPPASSARPRPRRRRTGRDTPHAPLVPTAIPPTRGRRATHPPPPARVPGVDCLSGARLRWRPTRRPTTCAQRLRPSRDVPAPRAAEGATARPHPHPAKAGALAKAASPCGAATATEDATRPADAGGSLDAGRSRPPPFLVRG